MNHTSVGLPFESFISNSAIVTNVELVDVVSDVFHEPRNTRITNTHSHLQFSFKANFFFKGQGCKGTISQSHTRTLQPKPAWR